MMVESPKRDDRLAADQVDEGLVRKVHDAGKQTGKDLPVALRLAVTGVKQVGAHQLESGADFFKIRARRGAFFFGGRCPRDNVAFECRVPIDLVTDLIALRDGKMIGQAGVFTLDRFAELQRSPVDRTAGLTQGRKRVRFSTSQ
ncbi:hypothetical protein G6F57_018426 [Rhizopus arrhizus]|nr:hypothetical protein G6F57_018426 [Rhizopus arrhizus]